MYVSVYNLSRFFSSLNLINYLASSLTSLICFAGAKLCMILDILGCSGSVTGVDVARHRLAASRTMLQKYALSNRCRLFIADGTTFSLIPVRVQSNCKSCNAEIEDLEIYKEWTPKRSWKERKRMAKARENIDSKMSSQIQDPELIFYGHHFGVVGLSKRDVYQNFNDVEILQFGYDKFRSLLMQNARTMVQLNSRSLNNGAGQHFHAVYWMPRGLMT